MPIFAKVVEEDIDGLRFEYSSLRIQEETRDSSAHPANYGGNNINIEKNANTKLMKLTFIAEESYL